MDILNDIAWYKAFFQTNSSYYLEKVQQFDEGKKFTFNVAAFFLGLIWMVYRKMYIEALCVVAILVVEGLIEEYIIANFFPASEQLISMMSTILFSIAIGFMANYLYIRKADRTIRKALAQDGPNRTAEEYLEKKGGTNWLGVVIVLAVLIGAAIMMVTLEQNNY